ncbi:hypothetical protein ACHAXR_003724 [Thalassiosira sp. AJA248-18]
MTSSLRRAAIVIGVSIIIVVSNHWLLAIRHVSDWRQSGPMLPSRSLATFRNGHRTNNGGSGGYREGADSNTTRIKPHDDSYILSPICGGCFRSRSNGKHCADLVMRRQKENKSTLLDAASAVGKENTDCKICDPDYCLEAHSTGGKSPDKSTANRYQTKYWRFDRTSPKFTNPTTLTLTSIPSELRIPPSRFPDIIAYFQEKYNISHSKSSMDFLVEYNPGLAAIPSEMKQFLPQEAAYLLSLRVTPANNCFPSSIYADLPKDVWRAIYESVTNHLGLALLNEKYQMIPGYDVVIDLGEQLNLKRNPVLFTGPNFMDFRLFTLNNEIYLHANADTVVVTKISLRAKGFGNNDVGVNSTALRDEKMLDQPYILKNLHGGDDLQVTLMHQLNTIWSGGFYSKNFALFGIPNVEHPDAPDSMYAEIDITPHHKVQQIHPEEYDQLRRQTVFEKLWKPGTKKRRMVDLDKVNMRMVKEVGNFTESEDAPLPKLSTVDEHWFPGPNAPFKEAAHGGACCVSFSVDELNLGGTKNNHQESLLVGVAHTKVSWKPWYSKANTPQEKKDRVPHTHYVSFFYAFDPYPPFQIRARSGYFCLGHVPLASGDKLPPTEGGTFNPHSILTRNRMLQQNKIAFDCPQVHYISSFIEKVADSSKTVIGYGLNDCTGRLIEVEKREIVRLLYPDPMDMVLEAT